jgi:hypothetical protein
MFSIKLTSFGFISPKTWVTLADVLYQAAKVPHVLGAIIPKDLSSLENIGKGLPCFRRNKTKGPKLDREHQLRSPMF